MAKLAHAHFQVVALIVFLAFTLPFSADAQPDTQTLSIGGTIEVPDRLGMHQFALEAEAGQTIALRWETAGDKPLHVTTAIVDAGGQTIEPLHRLETATSSTAVFALSGAGPYRIDGRVRSGDGLTLTAMDGDPITVSEQAAIRPGDTATGVVPADGELVVYPLDVQPGEGFTVFVLGGDPETGRAGDLAYPLTSLVDVRDANGQVLRPDARTDGRVYTAPDAVPLRLDMSRYGVHAAQMRSAEDAAYTVRVDPGNTITMHGEMLLPGQRIEHDGSGDGLYTFDAEEGDTVTLHLDADWNFLFDTGRILEFEPLENGIVNMTATMIRPVLHVETTGDRQRQRCVCVYTFEGPPPYALMLVLQVDHSHLGRDFTVQLDEGDTLTRVDLGTLTPGGMVQGSVPTPDGSMTQYTLGVEPGSTVTLSWGVPNQQYVIHEADGTMILPENNPWEDGYSVLDLSAGTPPFIVNVSVLEQAGTPYVFTLAEGEAPLPPSQAVLIPNTRTVFQPDAPAEASASTRPAGDTAAGESGCTITAGGSVNQRSGPGTSFDVAGSLTGGSSTTADGQATGGDGMAWYRLSSGSWVRSDVVRASAACAALPVVGP